MVNPVENQPAFEKTVPNAAYRAGFEAAVEASVLTLKYWPNPLNDAFDRTLENPVSAKEGIGNFSTMADEASEKAIIDIINSVPEIAKFNIVSEESDPINMESDWQWIIDPIDGTIPFKQGLPEFGISIGLLKGGEPRLGIVAVPAEGRILVAQKGQGLEIFEDVNAEGVKLDTSGQNQSDSTNDLVIAYDVGYSKRVEQLDEYAKRVIENVRYLTSYCSSSVSNYRVALGLLDGFFSSTPTVMDIAAATVLVEEAGGVVSQMDGSPIDWEAGQRTYLAARTPYIHQQLVRLLNEHN